MRLDHRATLAGSYVGFVTQAIVNNLGPLLFIIWHDAFGIGFGAIGLIVSVNFGVQLLTDAVSPPLIDKVGYRAAMVAAHVVAAAGLVALGTLPFLLPSPYLGLVLAMVISAVGGGLLEVLVSPVVEALPTQNKALHMSLLHSFYCWGLVAVVALSTVGFLTLGEDRWPLLCFAWAAVPALNAVLLWFVPYHRLVEEGAAMGYRHLLREPVFWLLVLLMAAAGASELSMSQWASAYAQAGLGLDKTTGDLMGPMAFAITMGLARVLFGARVSVKNVRHIITGCLVLCIASYLVAAYGPWPWLGLAGVIACGFSVGILWPGTFTLGSSVFRRGGTVLFALLALGGDAGAALGPAVVGQVAELTGSLADGIAVGTVFPVVMLAAVLVLGRRLSRGPAAASRHPGA
nr:MFS transporter [Propioniciclava soli]